MGSFQVEDQFRITGRGWVITGKCIEGEIQRGDVLLDEHENTFTVTGVERFVRLLGKPVLPGESAGLLIREMKTGEEIPRGTVLSSPTYVL